jgi:hypothetical protein
MNCTAEAVAAAVDIDDDGKEASVLARGCCVSFDGDADRGDTGVAPQPISDGQGMRPSRSAYI